jgi:hypothetical protein
VRLHLAADVLLVLREIDLVSVDVRGGDGTRVSQLRRYCPQIAAAGQLARLVADAVDASGSSLVLVPLIFLRRTAAGRCPFAGMRSARYARLGLPSLLVVR